MIGSRPDRIELHCHLDGSVRLSTLTELAGEQGVPLNAPIENLAVAPPSCANLMDYLTYFDIVLDLLQTPDALRRVAAELVEDWSADGVVYGEVRFAPQLHGRKGMTVDEAIIAVGAGLAEGRARTGVRTGLLLCCLRQHSPATSEAISDAAVRFAGTVAGLDLSGDESKPGAPHLAAFDHAHAAGLPVTIHAGEANGPASIWEALDVLGARRIGHGVRCVEDQALVKRLRTDAITLEMCPISNVQTTAIRSLSAHPAHELLGAGLAVTISTDARTTSATNLDREFSALRETFGWTVTEEQICQAHARAGAFAWK